MRRSALWAAILAAALTGPAPLAGQSEVRIEIVPRAGVTASANEAGRLVRLESGDYLAFGRIGAAPFLGAVARLGRGESPWSLRATVLRSVPVTSNVLATYDCVGGWDGDDVCRLALTTAPAKAGTTVATLGVGRVHSLGPTGRLRPSWSVGLGLRSYSLSWRSSFPSVGTGTEELRAIAVQLGAGVEWEWRGLSLVAALEDYASRVGRDDGGSSERPRPGDPPSPRRAGSGHIVHQLALSVGARLPVH